MAIKSMRLAWISVSNIKKAKEFFINTLGLKLENEAPEYGWMELRGKEDGFALGVGKEAEECSVKAGQNAVMTFEVDDIVATKKDLESKGVKFIDDIQEVPGHVKLATFVDTDGNVFQLVQCLS